MTKTNLDATRKPLDFTKIHEIFSEAIGEAFIKRDVQVLVAAFNGLSSNTDHDKKAPMDQVFREHMLFSLHGEVEAVRALVRLSVEAVRADIACVAIPVVLLGDIFDAVTIEKCERIFCVVEDMVEVWKEEIFFTSCKNNILRMCNDLLRRLSRAQNTVFCGRILLFLSKFFPFSERSGLNIVSEFNLDNVTEYGIDGKDLDDTLEDTVEDIPIKVDYNLYCKFWSLQDFFRNPNQCYSKAQWKMFQAHTGTVLESFSSFKLEEPNLSNSINSKDESMVSQPDPAPVKMEVDESNAKDEDDKTDSKLAQSIRKPDHFFAKFLTNPKLLALQLSDANFRRSVLIQFLILFQYLQQTVKFKTETNTLNVAQTEFIKETEVRVYQLLEETPPKGKRFARTVKHMLTREEMWNTWKNDGCKEFKKPEDTTSGDNEDGDTAQTKPPPLKRARRPLGDCLREANRAGKFFLGNDVLTKLWNYSPDNLLACKSEERNFLPQLETFLANSNEKGEPSFEWRALRLLARQSPHFFTILNNSTYKISDYLEAVRRKIAKDRIESMKMLNGAGGSEGVTRLDSNEQEGDTLQTQETEQEPDHELEEEANPNDLEKSDDDKNMHTRPMTATREQIEEIAPLLGDDWQKLGKKFGYTADELLFFEQENTDREAACSAMLSNWFADDDDASLDNLAYIMEGLKINTAAKAVKALIQRLAAKEGKEVLSD